MSGGGKPSLYQQSQGGKLNIFLYASVGIYRWFKTKYEKPIPFPNRYTVLLLDVTLFLLKAIGEIDFSHKWAQCLVLIVGMSFRGIHQIGLSQCESETLEGCFGGCSPSHWRRCLLLTGYYTVLMGTESCWVLLRITELYWISLLGSYSGHGIGKELALRLADLGCLVVCVDRLLIYCYSSQSLFTVWEERELLRETSNRAAINMKDEMYNWFFLCAGTQKLTRALWTRSKKLEVFDDDDNHDDGHSDEDHIGVSDISERNYRMPINQL